jgi:LacI family transcriptional regulator
MARIGAARTRTTGRPGAAGPAAKAGIRRVAEEAGVSTATVSRVMNGRGPVSAATRAHVLEVAGRLHYLPDASARSLRNARTMLLGVMVPDLGNPAIVPFLRGVQHVAQSRDYAVLVVDSQRSAAVERRALDRLAAQRVDALVLGGPIRDRARADGLQRAGMVIVDAGAEGGAAPPPVPELERPATEAMCDALAALGHRRLGFVTRRGIGGGAARRRWAAVRRRSRALGLATEAIAVGGAGGPDDVADVVGDAVLRQTPPVTAVVCATHGLAPTVLHGLRLADVDLPGRCSFVTYGDSGWAAAYRPAIAVVTLDLFAAAVLTTRRLLDELDGRAPAPTTAPPPAEFLPRGSIGPAPGGPGRAG